MSYVLALNGKEVAHPEDVEPHLPAYGGLGPPTLPRYRTPPRAVSVLAAEAGEAQLAEVTWRQGSKGAMTQARPGTRPLRGRTWRGRHHHVTLVTAAQAFLTLRRLDPKALAPARASTRPSTHSKTY
ncbi:transposase [Streptomyces aureus]|uniref:transposase n=1 Tax=Streptomyces aureus TaxID=193461 RepID=UPI0036C996BB